MINIAGVYRSSAIADCDELPFGTVIDANVKGVFFTAKAALATLTARCGI